jgi:uncharacterized protein YlzI (FlbEa/FlbD family)
MEIQKINRVKFSGKVYNFHCTPNQNYFSEGVLVHNCYKSNTARGKNMNLETFKKIFHKMHGSYIIIETDSEKIEVKHDAEITLISGKIIVAEKLKEGDEIKILNEKDIISKRSKE